jgi:hypothetical protein
MRILLLTGLLLTTAGCSVFDPYETRAPESVEAQATAADLRAEMERRCASMGGGVRQKDDSDGSRAGDWSCARERPKKK